MIKYPSRKSMTLTHRFERLIRRPLTAADAFCNRLYGWRLNPLYQSGTIVVVLLLVLIVTGVWLLLFYRVGAPWASVARLTEDRWLGNWVRGLHRYASDAALVATAVHAVRMFAQARSWGPRTLAWLSGLALVGFLLLLGWTGYLLVWDTFGHQLAVEIARLLDALPILSEPVSRAFVGERPVPGTFFFLNLFAHSALPLALGVGLWIHVSRLARSTLFPPRPLTWGVIGGLTLVAVAWPLTMVPAADPFVLPETVPVDWFYAFWLPVSRVLPPGAVWVAGLAVVAGLALVPRLARRIGADRPLPSVVDRQLCTACNQCAVDCPYEAITMVPRDDGRAERVARVEPARCVSCGICAGSCAPMGVGPPGRTGRDQLEALRGGIRDKPWPAGGVVVVACRYGAAEFGTDLAGAGAHVHVVECAGNLHTSVVEHALRAGAAGVLVLACPPRDCRGREGPRWLGERLYRGREAELQARVNRDRVRVAYANAAERREARGALAAFWASLTALDRPGERLPAREPVCVPAVLDEESAR